MACWRTKAAISLKRVKIDEKLLWRAYRNTPTLFRTVPSSTLYGLPLPKIGGSQPQPKTAIAIISGTGKATDCKLGRYIQRVHPNKSPLKFGRKGAWAYPGTAHIFEYPLLSRERVKLQTSNLAGTFAEQKPVKNFGKSSRERTQGLSKIFRAPIYRAHRAVIFAVAQLSCL